ncbi:MAG: hypothetical protein BWY43_00590 [candidate division WS2 bacterium ADurb.Bin280]|uniref:Uncharacterized protein n=1 Tax=candidate division WS2 bacterium ADurb.Bin280 TaxID=1852829 RepID=A0A1V5SDU3_9BACT|nr:MAG: hypothetical protein BWY43_00590 [candidate division WS2 bacterium ADurb.Bin280]
MEDLQMKFCPDCDYQGKELICPICHRDMIEDPTAEGSAPKANQSGESEDLIDTDQGVSDDEIINN